MKKIINQPECVVPDMCAGIVLAHPELALDAKYKIIYKKQLDVRKVTLISGGGSGHEPAHAGFVGQGMLDAAVCGDVFASPSQIQVYQAIRKTTSDAGTLLIIKNYSGDIMNFKNAAYLAAEDGIQVDYVKVDDDIAVRDSLYTVGRRGVAGTVFVHKIAGAAAEKGMTLPQVKAVAQKTAASVKSIGFALTSCTVPAKGTPTFELPEGEMEYGVGIHGEPGIRREPVMKAGELAARMAQSLCEELGIQNGGARVAVLVNGFGATPLMELYLFNHEIAREMAQRGIAVARFFVGNFMTSIDMAGASVSILKLDEELEELLNAPSQAAAFRVDGPVDQVAYAGRQAVNGADTVSFNIETDETFANVGAYLTLDNMVYMVDAMCESAIRNEVPFCELDAHAGDGDFGMSIAKGFRQLKREWNEVAVQDGEDISDFLNRCSLIIMEHCGGASGPIWGSAFRAAAKSVRGKKTLRVSDFAQMMQAAVQGIQSTGERSFGRGAVVGDKTLIDALVPCADAWSACAQKGETLEHAFRAGAEAAMAGAKSTEKITARMGRAGTVGDRSIGYADAGAYGLAVIFYDVATRLKFK
ncbi:MAG: dihydroxyacetone kinase subunit DhaK [Lawsonibacter sp.]